MKYIENLTQEERILKLLQERGSLGAYVYEFQTPRPQGLGVAQYNARIKGLRKKGHNIKNVVPGHFVLISEGESYRPSQSKPLEHTTQPLKPINIDGEVIYG